MSEPQEIAPSLLTKDEAARYLSVSSISVFRLARAGSLVHVRIGKSLRFRREDLDAFVQSKTSTTWKPVNMRPIVKRRYQGRGKQDDLAPGRMFQVDESEI